jgi:mevalonate kinase
MTTADDTPPRERQPGALADTRAFGKLILFGEHFVVYNVPALVGAIAAYTECECVIHSDRPAAEPSWTVLDHRPAVPHYKRTKAAEATAAIQLVLDHFQWTGKNNHMTLTFGGTLCCASGIGASAAQVVSLARALSHTLALEWSEDAINAAGYEGEKGYHGTPSGIDNTAATFGGVLKFQRTAGAPIFTKKTLAGPIRIVYASTGITSSTTQVVGDVRAVVCRLVATVCGAGGTSRNCVGCTGLAHRRNVDESESYALSSIDRQLSGIGCVGGRGPCRGGVGGENEWDREGGLMLALTPTVEVQEAVAKALEEAGAPQVWKTEFA